MDSLTHLYFADHLLRMTGRDRRGAVASLFPQIDRVPAYFHRLYAHPVAMIPRLLPAAAVYWGGRARGDAYAVARFRAERPRMRGFQARFERATGRRPGRGIPDRPSLVIGWLSHVYQDTFNNPVQAFAPERGEPCGQWALWRRLGDLDWRRRLYGAGRIGRFRSALFTDPRWGRAMEPRAVVAAMLERTAAASLVRVPGVLIARRYRDLAVGPRPAPRDVAAARSFFTWMERRMAALTIRIAGRRAAAGPAPVGS